MIELDCYNCVTCGEPCSSRSAAGPWIPVGERLPEIPEGSDELVKATREVFCWTPYGCYAAFYHHGFKEWILPDYGGPLNGITHWAEIRGPK